LIIQRRKNGIRLFFHRVTFPLVDAGPILSSQLLGRRNDPVFSLSADKTLPDAAAVLVQTADASLSGDLLLWPLTEKAAPGWPSRKSKKQSKFQHLHSSPDSVRYTKSG
jgi:hypothetical protein